MFLKSVKARGFKSFGRPVEFAFQPGITVVVGPNGSGKSNIADAVVWAMGEQSPSALRGSSMQDVIFTGSDRLSPAGMAEVELVFDNNDGLMPIEFSEVMVSRQVHRDGESSYRINRSACRLIDVAELLSDAGLGRNGHSIISQGKVDLVLESKAEERRAHIEEAAGLGKFKKRRRRAELKLEAVYRNLDRLNDVEEEVKAQLRPLKRQATAAERSEKLKLRIAREQTRLIKGRLVGLNEHLEAARNASRAAAERRAGLERQLSSTAQERRLTEEKLTGSLEAHKKLADRFYGLKSRQEALDNRLEGTRERQETIAHGKRNAAARAESLREQMERSQAEIERAEADHSGCERLMGEAEARLRSGQEELSRLELELDNRRRQSEEKTRRVGELAALKDRYTHQVEYLSQRRQKLAGSMERVVREAETLRTELTGLRQKIDLEKDKLAEWRQKERSAGSDLAGIVEEQDGLKGERQDLASELRRMAEDLRIAKARLTFISDSQQQRSGLPAGAKEISISHGLKALVDLIEVEPGYEKAVSAVLGSMLFALVVGDISEAERLLAEAQQNQLGSIEFLMPQPRMPVDRRPGVDYLVDHVILPDAQAGFISALLSGVRVVDELNGHAGTAPEGTWVSREGVVFRAGERLLSFKADPPSSVVLRQRGERRQLEDERDAAEAHHRELEAEIETVRIRLSELEEPRRRAEQRLQRAAENIKVIEDSLAAAERRQSVLIQEVDIREATQKNLEAEDTDLDRDLKEASRRLDETGQAISEAGGVAADGADGALTARRQELVKDVTDLQIAAARLRERKLVAAQTVERLGPALESFQAELEGTVREQEAYRSLAPATGRLLAVMRKLNVVFGQVLEGVEEQIRAGEQESNLRSTALRTLSQSEAELQQQLHRASDDSTANEVELSRLGDQVQEQSEQLRALSHNYPGADLDREEAAEAGGLEEVEDGIERLSRRLEAIGPVNPLAQQEYEEMRERQEFLKEQRSDLESSLKELNSLIRELTGRIEANFTETFEAVRRNFSEVVSTLFPGGEGRLTLVEPRVEQESGEADGETTAGGDRRGIEISVKPARKAVRSLSLLSGGERSLVAIAFLFAIFLARPAPFYILDEVEAALDDLNIDRLLAMLKRYQSRTQFLVITHQKRTMEVADVLYGVSMSRDGTSKVLSRRMPSGDGDASTKPIAEAAEGERTQPGGKAANPAPAALAG